MSSYKFSGEVYLDYHDSLYEFDLPILIGESPFTKDDIDFEYGIKDALLNEPELKAITSGRYLVYFTGVATWEKSWSEEEVEYDLITELDYISVKKLQEDL